MESFVDRLLDYIEGPCGQDETHYVLDGKMDGRPVLQMERGQAPRPVAESFENHCFQTAWTLFMYKPLATAPYVDFYSKPGAIEGALGAAEKRGLALESFSESGQKFLSGHKLALALRRHEDYWRIAAAASDGDRARELATTVGGASGALLPKTRYL